MKIEQIENKIKELEFSNNYKLLSETLEENKIKIECKIHGIFNFYFYRNNECRYCLNQKKEIENIENKYNYNYDYTKSNFKDKRKKTIVICKKHGEFNISEEYLIKGGKCPKCLSEEREEKRQIYFKKKFEEKYNNKFKLIGKYNNSKNNITFLCNNCGSILEGNQIDLIDKRYRRCEFCEYIKQTTKENFLERAIKIHGNNYEYDLSNMTNSHSFITIKCKKHNYSFKQKVYSHLAGHGCKICNESLGEKKIRMFLENNNIYFECYKTFLDLKDVNNLSYDFYLPKYNMLIEFNGEQHYRFCNDFHKTLQDFEKQKYHDLLKNNYAINNGYKLLTISYKEYKIIENILEENIGISN